MYWLMHCIYKLKKNYYWILYYEGKNIQKKILKKSAKVKKKKLIYWNITLTKTYSIWWNYQNYKWKCKKKVKKRHYKLSLMKKNILNHTQGNQHPNAYGEEQKNPIL